MNGRTRYETGIDVRRLIAGVCACAVALLGFGAGTAGAATIQVDSGTDDGTGCTLREAITAATSGVAEPGCSPPGVGNDTITFAPSVTGTIPLASELVINPTTQGTVEIQGPGAETLAVSGQDASRVFQITDNADNPLSAVTISGLEIRDGLYTSAVNPIEGGGIASSGILTLDRVLVADNVVTASSTDPNVAQAITSGAGIASRAHLTVIDSTIHDNTVSASADSSGFVANAVARGGGIHSMRGGATIRNSTISGNSATTTQTGTPSVLTGSNATGAGLAVTSLDQANAVVLESSTIAGNVLNATGATPTENGGGIQVETGGQPTTLAATSSTIAGNEGAARANTVSFASPITLRNTVIADPQGGGVNCGGAVISQGHNLSDDDTCGLGMTGDQDDVPASLGPLTDNGGLTQTRRPAPGSELIDGGVAAGLTSDQRGLMRTVEYDTANGAGGDGTDIGAVEIQGAIPTDVTPDSPNADTTPEVIGTAEPGSTVYVFSDAGCATNIGFGTPQAFAAPGINVGPLAPGSTYELRAFAEYGMAFSACSPTGVSYTVPALAPPPGTGTPPVTTPPPAAPKKCKKGQKLKGGRCVKKKKKKRKK